MAEATVEKPWYQDIIGTALDIYKAREQGKIDTRLAASKIQADQYAETWRLQQAQQSQQVSEAAGAPKWALQLAGLLAVGAVIYLVAR